MGFVGFIGFIGFIGLFRLFGFGDLLIEVFVFITTDDGLLTMDVYSICPCLLVLNIEP